MMCKGFLIECSRWDEQDGESSSVNLAVTDNQALGFYDPDTVIVNIKVGDDPNDFALTRDDALALVEALSDIIERYPEPTDEPDTTQDSEDGATQD